MGFAGIWEALCAEAEIGDDPLVSPASSMEWLQFMIFSNTGHKISDVALREARLGVLYALRDVPDILVWSEAFLAELKNDAESLEAQGLLWAQNVHRICGDELRIVGQVLCVVAARHRDLLSRLPAQLESSWASEHSAAEPSQE